MSQNTSEKVSSKIGTGSGVYDSVTNYSTNTGSDYEYTYEYESYTNSNDVNTNSFDEKDSVSNQNQDELSKKDNISGKPTISAPNSIYSNVTKSADSALIDNIKITNEDGEKKDEEEEEGKKKNTKNRFNLQRKMETASKIKKLGGGRIQDTIKVNKMRAQANVATSDAIFKNKNNNLDLNARFLDTSSKAKNIKMSSISRDNTLSVDWFSLRDILESEPISSGMVNILPPDESGIPIRVSSLSIPNLQQYSIFEADNCRYVPSDLDYGFPSCAPSKKTTHLVPPILQKNLRTSKVAKTISLTGWLFLQILKVAMLVCYFVLRPIMLINQPIPTSGALTVDQQWYKFMLGVGCLVTLAEIFFCFFKSIRAIVLFEDAKKTVYSQLFEASAVLATALPRTLLSECGKGKFLRKQADPPKFSMAILSCFSLISFLILLIPLTLSLYELSPAIWKLLLLSPKTDLLTSNQKIVYALEQAPYLLIVSMVCSSIEYFFEKSIIKSTDTYRELLANSMACNLRGFIPGRGFGLDFSVIHGVEEGLCYIMGQAGTNMSDSKNIITDAEFHSESDGLYSQRSLTNSKNQKARNTGGIRIDMTNINYANVNNSVPQNEDSNADMQNNPFFGNDNINITAQNVLTNRKLKKINLWNKKYRDSIYRTNDDGSLASSAIFVPFLSIVDIELHLEPIDITLTYEFTSKQLVTIDSRSHVLANDILKRGYDSMIVRDILPWVILVLANGIRMWIPLSLSQMKPEMFGATGNEMAAILDVVAACLEVEGGDLEQNKSAIDKIELNNSKIEANIKTTTYPLKFSKGLAEKKEQNMENPENNENNIINGEDNMEGEKPEVNTEVGDIYNDAAIGRIQSIVNGGSASVKNDNIPNAVVNNVNIVDVKEEENNILNETKNSETDTSNEEDDINMIQNNENDYFSVNNEEHEVNISLAKKLRYLSQFCRDYEEFKSSTPLEEVLHIRSIEKNFIPQSN